MNIIDIIIKKKNKLELSESEIKYVVENFVNGNIKDYQMSSLLMAIVINGMNDDEIFYLTKYMVESGKQLDLSSLGNVVDKHSTGGVGDKTTLIIAPIVAACGVKVAKMSGRALGYTGGTIDKLESIPGIKLNLDEEEFISQIKKINVAITSQTENIALADKKIYALRDVTGTVESIPLIASSIMSKKIAMGAKNLVIDIKVGNGALIKNIDDARKLANIMINLGKTNGIKIICLLTNMDIPLGNCIGNSLEIKEAIDILMNKEDNNLKKLCVELASYMVMLGLNININAAREKVVNSIVDGSAYNKFRELISYQNGNLDSISIGEPKYQIKAKKSGYINNINAIDVGKLAMMLGAGRENKEDEIDYNAGVVLCKNIGDYVEKNEVIMNLYTNKDMDVSIDIDIVENKQKLKDLVFEVIGL